MIAGHYLPVVVLLLVAVTTSIIALCSHDVPSKQLRAILRNSIKELLIELSYCHHVSSIGFLLE